MIGYVVPVTCPACGGAVAPLAQGVPVAGTEVSAMAACTGCHREWHVQVHLRPAPATPVTQRNTERQRERRARLKATA